MPNMLYAIGNTPMVRLNKIPKEENVKCEMGMMNYSTNKSLSYISFYVIRFDL